MGGLKFFTERDNQPLGGIHRKTNISKRNPQTIHCSLRHMSYEFITVLELKGKMVKMHLSMSVSKLASTNHKFRSMSNNYRGGKDVRGDYSKIKE